MDNEIPTQKRVNFIPFILLPLKTCESAESSYHSIYQTSVIVVWPKMRYSCCFLFQVMFPLFYGLHWLSSFTMMNLW